MMSRRCPSYNFLRRPATSSSPQLSGIAGWNWPSGSCGRFSVRLPEVEILLVQRIVALEDGVELLHRLGAPSTMGILPRSFGRVDVVLDVLDVASSLEQQHAKAFLGELLGGPPAGDSGT